MSNIVNVIRGFDGLHYLGVVDDADIKKAESELAVRFSPEYKEYTSVFGAVTFGGAEYTGAVKPTHLSVVDVTRSARKITPSAKPEWYVVMDPHFDGIIIWQDESGNIYQTEPAKAPKKIAESLEEYMKNG